MPPIRFVTPDLGNWLPRCVFPVSRTWWLVLCCLTMAADGAPAQPSAGAGQLAPVVEAERLPANMRNAAEPSLVAVVCPPTMLPALTPWRRQRAGQGMEMVHVDSRLPTPLIRQQLQEIARQRPLKYVLLIGDADVQMAFSRPLRAASVPTFYYEAKIIKQWGPEPVIATDNPYGDLDGDGVPELAVGRLAADSPAELARLVEKILYYESLPAGGTWRRRIHLTAGVGDFGPLTDSMVETAARRFLTDGIPPAYRVTMAYGSWRSPYCPDPRAFRECVVNQLREGCLFWGYLGHGWPHRLDRIRFGDSVLPIVEPADVGRLQTDNGLPIAVLMACYTGAFDQPHDCLAEHLLRAPRGPVAVICGSRVTMPYAMSLLGTALMDGCFQQRIERLGDVLLYAKQRLAAPASDEDWRRKTLDALAMTFHADSNALQGERSEHQLIFHLLGDPTLKLSHPEEVGIECASAIEAGQTLQVHGTASMGGTCLVELCCRRDGFTFSPPKRRQRAVSEDELIEMSQVYRRANNRCWCSKQITVKPGPFVVELVVPEHARGFGVARAFIQGEDNYALGSAPVYIRKAAATVELPQPNALRR